MSSLFRSNTNFRNYLIASTLYGIGAGVFSIFMLWSIHDLHQSTLYTGLAGFLTAAPMVLSIVVGPLVDRWNKAKVLRLMCFIDLCVIASVLAMSVFMTPNVWLLLAAVCIFSATKLFVNPAGVAILPQIIGADDLVKANAFSQIFSLLGGLLVGVGLYIMMELGAAFSLVYAVNVVFMLLALVVMQSVRSNEPPHPEKSTYFKEIREGFAFIKGVVLLPLMTAFIFLGFFSDMAYANIPMFAQTHFGAATGYIILTALALLGSLLGAAIAAFVESKYKVWVIFIFGFFLAGTARVLFVLILPNSIAAGIAIYMVYVGLGSSAGIFFQSLLQRITPKHLTSRVLTIFVSLISVAGAVGAVIGGILGMALTRCDCPAYVYPYVCESACNNGSDIVLMIQGAFYAVIGIFLLFSKRVRALPMMKDIAAAETAEPSDAKAV